MVFLRCLLRVSEESLLSKDYSINILLAQCGVTNFGLMIYLNNKKTDRHKYLVLCLAGNSHLYQEDDMKSRLVFVRLLFNFNFFVSKVLSLK